MVKSWDKELNQPQLKAVTFGKGPLLILAGAGSGKTRALTYRTAYLINHQGIDPKRILLVTFTNKAAKEMKNRIKILIGKSQLPFTGTFHSFGARFLRIEGKSSEITNNFLIYDEADSIDTIKLAMNNLNLDPKLIKPGTVKAVISQAKNELIGAIEYSQFARGEKQEKIAVIYREYQRLLKTYHALDFDDLLMETVKLLKKDPAILDKYRQRYEYVLVDEYQDTNKAQYELTKMLSGRWRNLCAVGDFSQSIYSWRGADLRNLNNLKKDYLDLTIIKLEQNYRSTENILEAANLVIKKNVSHQVLNLWTDAGKGEKIKSFCADSEKVEAAFIVNQILSSKKNYADFAVLYRTNAQSRAIEEGLIKAGIPYMLVGGVKFYSRKEIKDCLSYLRFIFNPKDAISYQRMEKLGKKRLEKFINWKENNQDKIMKMSTKNILNQVLKATDYLALFDTKNEEDLMRLENIKELTSVAEEWKILEEFLENVALVEQTDLLPEKINFDQEKNNAVTLMTLHASKGLEFKTVFMIGMEEGLFPHARSLDQKDALEEERRLCYVGMTRAKEQLYFSYADRRLYFGRYTANAVSRFLGDIEENLLEKL